MGFWVFPNGVQRTSNTSLTVVDPLKMRDRGIAIWWNFGQVYSALLLESLVFPDYFHQDFCTDLVHGTVPWISVHQAYEGFHLLNCVLGKGPCFSKLSVCVKKKNVNSYNPFFLLDNLIVLMVPEYLRVFEIYLQFLLGLQLAFTFECT